MEQTNSPQTIVVNRKNHDFDVYIGRGSPFGNPYKIGEHGTRDEVIEKYERYFSIKVTRDLIFRKSVLDLRGHVLGCYCKPLRCHGDVIVKFLDDNDK